MKNRGGGGKKEKYIVEFISLGNAVKVTAIDPVTLREVSMVGAKKATRKQLIDLAVRKLEYVLDKEQGES